MTEALLWQNFKLGSKAAFEEIFTLFHEDLYRYGSKMTKNGPLLDDVIQELFLELWQNKEQLADVISVKGYLFRALKFKLFREIKREGRLTPLADDWEEHAVFSHEAILLEEQTEFELKQRLIAHLEGLTKRQREALYLRFNSQLSYDEIALVMDISYQGVVNIVYKSIKFLREKMLILIGFCLIN